jgi:homospermidine synthase
MTKKEKVLISYLKQQGEFKDSESKDLLKFIHTVNPLFENISIFSWSEHHGDKKTKNKLKKLYS